MFQNKFYITDINDTIIKGICKLIPLILPRYHDKKSQILVKDLTESLIESYPESSIKNLVAVLHDVAQQYKNLVAT